MDETINFLTRHVERTQRELTGKRTNLSIAQDEVVLILKEIAQLEMTITNLNIGINQLKAGPNA